MTVKLKFNQVCVWVVKNVFRLISWYYIKTHLNISETVGNFEKTTSSENLSPFWGRDMFSKVVLFHKLYLKLEMRIIFQNFNPFTWGKSFQPLVLKPKIVCHFNFFQIQTDCVISEPVHDSFQCLFVRCNEAIAINKLISMLIY